MTKIKDKLIEELLNKPFEVGDQVKFQGEGNGSQDKNWWGTGVIEKILKNSVYIDTGRGQEVIKDINSIEYNGFYVGTDPFPKKDWRRKLRIVNYNLESIVFSCGYDKRKRIMKSEKFGEVEVPEITYKPFVINSKGEKEYYQRGFVWSLKDKQLLIESIYNNIDIGKIVIRKRSWGWVEGQVSKGEQTAFKDVVDGVQRLSTILGFLNDEFPDSQGNYFSDFSSAAENKFFDFSSVAYGELDENCTDQDTLDVFLGVNFTGVPMSQEHIDFVKSINV